MMPARVARCKLLFAVALLCLCAGTARASEYHGRVTYGGMLIPGVTVTATQGARTLSTVTDTQGTFLFPDLGDGVWKIHVEMRGFVPSDGEANVSANTAAGAWELTMQPLATLLAEAQAAPTAVTPQPLQTRSPLPAPKSKAAESAEVAPKPPEEAVDQGADGLLVNGSENNAATSKYSLAPAFGNQRSGSKALYTGSIGAYVSDSVFDARPYSLTGLSIPKAGYSHVTTVVTLGGPLNIPHLLPHGPNFFVAYQWTRDRSEDSAQGLVPTDAQRAGQLSSLLNAQGQPAKIYDPKTGASITNDIPAKPGTVAYALLQLYPEPNLGGNTRYNYERRVLANDHVDALQSKFDKSIGRRDSFYGGLAFSSARANSTSLFGFVDTTNTFGLTSNVHWSHRFPHSILMNLGYDFSRLRTQVRPYFESLNQNVSGDAGIANLANTLPNHPANGGNNQERANWGPPTLIFAGGISPLNDAISSFNRNRADAVSASATWVHRRHNVTFGGDFRRQEFNENGQQNPRGTYTFTGAATGDPSATAATGSDFADFLLGTPDTSALATGNADKYFRQSVSDLYVTDDWRLKPELTLNVGLRWDYGAPISELFGRLVNLDLASGFKSQQVVLGSNPKGAVTGRQFPSSLVQPDHLGFQPRIGISWRPLPASTLVVRAGYGIYDDTSVYLSAAEFMAQQAPLSTSVSVSNGPGCALTLAAGFINCTGITADTFAIDPNFRVGYAQTWQLAVQRDLPAALVVSATYLGVKGTHGMQEFLPNTYAPGGVDPYAGLPRGFVYRTSGGNSTRESGQLQLRRRLRSGVAANLQYTYSKSIDNDALVGAQGHTTTASATTTGTASGGGSPTIAQNWLDLRRGERGRSNFDQRHLLAATLQYTSGMGLHGGTLLTGWRGRLFKDWTVSTTFSAGSGLPETPVYYEAVPQTGVTGTIRPSVTGAPIYRTSSTPQGYFLNANAYAAPQAGQWGNSGRNSITGPSLFSMDGALARTFQLKKSRTFDVRADASNLLNHVNFTSWNTTVNSTTFGLPASVKAMRSLQFTGRFRF